MKALAFALAALSLATTTAAAETVTITLTGVEARPGRIMAGGVTLTFENVAPGDYALMVMHDLDSDGQFNLGRDGWAFSNSARPLTGPPAFDDHKFAVGDAPVALTETLRYGF